MRFLSFFGILGVAASFGAHCAVFVWVQRTFPRLATKRERLFLIAFAIIAFIPFLARFAVVETKSPLFDLAFSGGLLEQMFIIAIAIPLLILRGVTALGGRRRRKAAKVTLAARLALKPESPAPAPQEAVGRRGAIETIGGVAAIGATGFAFGWGMTIGRHDYELREVAVRIAGLPKALDGYVIAQISDIHAGLFVGERELRDGAELIRKARPDLVVATGDLVDFDARHAPSLARALADIAPRDGVFAILGNHDYYAGHAEVSAAIRAAGITLLVNDARLVRPADGGGFALVGIDEMWAARYGGRGPNLRAATASLPRDAARILLAHHPEEFVASAGKVALQLSGHTHGGQIRPANLVMRGPVAGRYDRDGSVLYVNRGFGVAGPPARLGVPPEITKIVLVAT